MNTPIVTPSAVHEGECHAFYVGDGYNLVNNTDIRVDIIEVVNAIPTLLFFVFLIITVPFSIQRFCRGGKGQFGLVAYFILIWATASLRVLRFVILWALMGGDAPSHVTMSESIAYIISLSLADSIEVSVLLLFTNGIFGNPKWLDRRVIIQSIAVFVVICTCQFVLTFVGGLALYQDDNPKNAPFWFTTELCFTFFYAIIISFKYIPGPNKRFPANKLILLYCVLLFLMHALAAVGQGLMMTHQRGAFCAIVIGNIAYYLTSTPLLYATFLGAYLHPGCSRSKCCGKDRFESFTQGDDSLYEYQPVESFTTSKSWIPPSQLNINSPYYPRNGSGYLSTSMSETEEPIARTTDASDFDFATYGQPTV